MIMHSSECHLSKRQIGKMWELILTAFGTIPSGTCALESRDQELSNGI